jgi:intein/homing endonuclease
MEFFKEYMNYIIDNDFIILGGNDNSDNEHCLAEYHVSNGSKETYVGVFKEDDVAFKNGNYWVVLSEERKLRIKFNDGDLEPVYPELIDIKITDYCDKGCNYCFTEGTLVNTPHGKIPIDQLKQNDKVFAFDEKSSKKVINTIDQLHSREYSGELILLELENGKILEVTPNHEIYTLNRGWVPAGELTLQDELQAYEDM